MAQNLRTHVFVFALPKWSVSGQVYKSFGAVAIVNIVVFPQVVLYTTDKIVLLWPYIAYNQVAIQHETKHVKMHKKTVTRCVQGCVQKQK